MPYIEEYRRLKFIPHLNQILDNIKESGEMTYCIFWLMVNWLRSKSAQNYNERSNSKKVCRDALDEYMRRYMDAYEDRKIKENGDI